MRAKISKTGAKILENRKVSDAMVLAILQNKDKLVSGEAVQFDVVIKDSNQTDVIEKGTVQIVFSSFETAV